MCVSVCVWPWTWPWRRVSIPDTVSTSKRNAAIAEADDATWEPMAKIKSKEDCRVQTR